MICVSINYKKADERIRGLFAFDGNKRKQLSVLLTDSGAAENVILCTCSRTEIYACGNISAEQIMKKISELSGAAEIKQYVMIFVGNSAISHLFRVACGIDSMVMGEDEILGQTRNAYKEACDRGNVSNKLHMIFQAAIACAKKIKTDTSVSGIPVSAATLAANEAVHWGNDIFIIGASGKIGNSTLKNILSHKNARVTVTARKHIPDIGEKMRDRVKIVPYEDRYLYIDGADCVISATSCPVYTLTGDKLLHSIFSEKPRLFIDLAVPRDIDESISEMKNVRLLGIDCFKKIAEKNNDIKLSERDKAEAIIKAETETLRKGMAMQNFLSLSRNVKSKLDEKGIEPLMYKLKSELSADSFEEVAEIIGNFGKD